MTEKLEYSAPQFDIPHLRDSAENEIVAVNLPITNSSVVLVRFPTTLLATQAYLPA